jgi:hypothetical protein
VLDRITQACQEAGSYTLSVGTMRPAVVVKRLLTALAALDPNAHGRITGPEGEYGKLPPDAFYDESGWWDTEQANAFVLCLIAAINAAAPKGFACSWSHDDRLELVPIDPPPTEGVRPAASGPPPHVSALRMRVNVRPG